MSGVTCHCLKKLKNTLSVTENCRLLKFRFCNATKLKKEFSQNNNQSYTQTLKHKTVISNICECKIQQILFDNKMNDVEKKVKSNSCNISQRTFTFKKSLTRHNQTVHEKVKPFLCNICQKTFPQKNSLIGHIQTVHENLKLFLCNIPNNCTKCNSETEMGYFYFSGTRSSIFWDQIYLIRKKLGTRF